MQVAQHLSGVYYTVQYIVLINNNEWTMCECKELLYKDDMGIWFIDSFEHGSTHVD